MNIEQQRADFECFMSDNGKFPQAIERDANGNYVLMQAASSWHVWQAAIALNQQGRVEAEQFRDLITLRALAKDFYNKTVADPEVRITSAVEAKRDLAAEAAANLRHGLVQSALYLESLKTPTPPAAGQAQQAVTFVHELAIGAYKPEEIETRAKAIAKLSPLAAQQDADKVDAERYRWWREYYFNDDFRPEFVPGSAETPEQLDAGIGAARAQQGGQS